MRRARIEVRTGILGEEAHNKSRCGGEPQNHEEVNAARTFRRFRLGGHHGPHAEYAVLVHLLPLSYTALVMREDKSQGFSLRQELCLGLNVGVGVGVGGGDVFHSLTSKSAGDSLRILGFFNVQPDPTYQELLQPFQGVARFFA